MEKALQSHDSTIHARRLGVDTGKDPVGNHSSEPPILSEEEQILLVLLLILGTTGDFSDLGDW